MISSNLKELHKNFPDKLDAFICCSSFEDRCLAITEHIKNVEIDQAYIFYNPNYHFRIGENALILKESLKECNPEMVTLEIQSPTNYINIFIKTIRKVKEKGSVKIAIDITTFTHESLLILFNTIRHFTNTDDSIYFLYDIAKDYAFDEKNIDSKWLAKGISDIRSILTYPGILHPAKQYHLLILVGFEVERTKKFIEKYDTSRVSIGLGRCDVSTHYMDNVMKITNEKHRTIKKLYPHVSEFEFSLSDPLITRDDIIKYIGSNQTENFIIAPMSNKVSTIGAALAAIKKPTLQLCYASANQHNVDNYSKPSDDYIMFTLNELFE